MLVSTWEVAKESGLKNSSLNRTWTLPSAMPVQYLTSWTIRPTGSWSLCGSMISLRIVDICVLINEVSFELRREMISMLMIFVVMISYLSSSERKAWMGLKLWPLQCPCSALPVGQWLLNCKSTAPASPFRSEFFHPFFRYSLLKKHNITVKMINIEIVSMCSSNETSLVKTLRCVEK